MKAKPYLEQCLELEGNQLDPMADFSSSRFGKVDFVLVKLRPARTHRGPRRTGNNLLRLDIVEFQAFDWSSRQTHQPEIAGTSVDSKTSICSRWFAADAGRSHVTGGVYCKWRLFDIGLRDQHLSWHCRHLFRLQ